MTHSPRPERHSTFWHRVACEVLRGATYAGPAPLQAPGLPGLTCQAQQRYWAGRHEADGTPYPACEPGACPRCGARRQVNVDGATVHAHLGRTLCDDDAPGPDSTDDEIRQWAHLCTRYTPDGYPYVPRQVTP